MTRTRGGQTSTQSTQPLQRSMSMVTVAGWRGIPTTALTRPPRVAQSFGLPGSGPAVGRREQLVDGHGAELPVVELVEQPRQDAQGHRLAIAVLGCVVQGEDRPGSEDP